MADQADHRLRDALAALPDAPLPGDLWPRVARARTRQLAHRRLALGGAAAAVFAALLLPIALVERDMAPGGDARMATTTGTPPRATAASDASARLRSLDRELQAAYRRGSGSAEIAQLWEARSALLRAPATAAPVRPVRI